MAEVRQDSGGGPGKERVTPGCSRREEASVGPRRTAAFASSSRVELLEFLRGPKRCSVMLPFCARERVWQVWLVHTRMVHTQ